MPRTEEAKQRVREEQRAKILEAARRVFARKGLAATVDEVAAEAAVSHGLAYRYFANKEAMFAELVMQDLQDPAAGVQSLVEMAGTPGERLGALVAGFVESRRKHPERYQLLDQALSQEATPEELRQAIRRRGKAVRAVVRQLIMEGQGSGEVAAGDPDQLVRAIFACLNGLTRWVVYDRRGSWRSALDNLVEGMSLEEHSEDAQRLLAALTSELAYVFGSSAGALIGLDLAMRYPGQVRRLVAHEPPVVGVLPEFDQLHADTLETAVREGALPALMKLMAKLGVSYAEVEAGAELPQRNPRSSGYGDAFFAYTFQAVHRYRLDMAALPAAQARIVLAAGSAGRAYPGYRCTAAVAERLGKAVVEFPSHHAGYISHPRAFAERLREVLGDGP